MEGWEKSKEKRCPVCRYPVGRNDHHNHNDDHRNDHHNHNDDHHNDHDQVCGVECAKGARHRVECKLLAGQEEPNYAPVIIIIIIISVIIEIVTLIIVRISMIIFWQVTPLRMLLLQEAGGDPWLRLFAPQLLIRTC